MPQYQVDSEQIQSSSAAVNASIQSIRQAVQGMYGNLNNLPERLARRGCDAVHSGRRTVACRAAADGAVA